MGPGPHRRGRGAADRGAAGRAGRAYQVQAAIAAVHDEADCGENTDWPQILGLYDVLDQLAPGPMVSLNRAVAVAMVAGPAAGLAVLADLAADGTLADHHRLMATRAHLLEMAGDRREHRVRTARRRSAPPACRNAGTSRPRGAAGR